MAKVINVNGYMVNLEEKEVTMKPMYDKHGESYTFLLKKIVKDDNQKMILATMEWMAQDVARIKWATTKDAKGQLIYKLPCVSWILPVARNTRATWVTDSSSQNVRNEVRNALIAYFKAVKGQDDPKKPEPPKPEQSKKADSKDAAADYGQQLLAQAMAAAPETETKEVNSDNKEVVMVFTDGACSPNPGMGGWGIVMYDAKGGRHEYSGAEADSTNNRMELTGPIEALKKCSGKYPIVLTSDSNYLVKGMTEWIQGWIQKGWKNSQRQPVPNKDLWEELLALTQGKQIEWKWVKGHGVNADNNRCDQLAVTARESLAAELAKQAEEIVYEDGTSDDLLGSDEEI